MTKVFELDILDKEIKENLPYWLEQKNKDPEAQKRIREKHRARWLAEQKAKKQNG